MGTWRRTFTLVRFRGGSRGAHAIALFLAFAVTLVATAPVGQEHLGDIVLDRTSTSNGLPAVVFPHWKHRIRFRCYTCHPDEFAMERGANEITMDAIRTGGYCGRCHDGNVAFPVAFETCRECHSYEGP
jgi:c(7)-type cytochrome triheme protein